MNDEFTDAEQDEVEKLTKIARAFWWFMILTACASIVLLPLSLAGIVKAGAAHGLTLSAMFFFFLTIDFSSSAKHTKSIMELQNRIATLETKLTN